MAGLFNEQAHPRGKGAQGGQFVAKGNSGANDTIGYDAKRGTGAGYGTGAKGDNRVKSLQTYLNSIGVTDAQGRPLKVDGKLGPKTTAAIKRLQRRMGIKADGLVTPALLHKLRQASLAKGKKSVPAKKVGSPAKKAVPRAGAPTKAPAAPAKKAASAKPRNATPRKAAR